MADYDKYPNSGTLGVNERQREGGNDPDYSGQCCVDGVKYWINGWMKEGQTGEFMSLSFRAMDRQGDSRGGGGQSQGRPQQGNSQHREGGFRRPGPSRPSDGGQGRPAPSRGFQRPARAAYEDGDQRELPRGNAGGGRDNTSDNDGGNDGSWEAPD